MGGKPQAVRQIDSGICIFHVNRLLGSGDYNGFQGALNQIGECGCSIGQGIGAVTDYEAVIALIILLNGGGNLQPMRGLNVGAVDVENLSCIHLAVLPAGGDKGQKFI